MGNKNYNFLTKLFFSTCLTKSLIIKFICYEIFWRLVRNTVEIFGND